MKDSTSFLQLVDSFSKLPGIGEKSAERMAYAVLEMSEDDALGFSNAITKVKQNIHKCPKCGNYTEEDVCDICSNPERDHSICVVVSLPKDVNAFEKLQQFNCVYHILGGVLSPSKGVGVGDLEIDSLVRRIDEENIKELIIATNPTLEGETTAMYIAKLLEGKEVKVTRLAYGLPMGASIDYADALTLSKALEGRKKL